MYTQAIHFKNEKAISYLYKLSLSSVEAAMQPKFINKKKALETWLAELIVEYCQKYYEMQSRH